MRWAGLVSLLLGGLVVTAQGRPGSDWAQVLLRFRWHAANGVCSPVRFQPPPCPSGFSRYFVVDDPPAGRSAGLSPMLTLQRGLPRSTPVCARGLHGMTAFDDRFLREEGRDVIAVVNRLDNHVSDLATTERRCRSFAAAQAEAARSGEPY